MWRQRCALRYAGVIGGVLVIGLAGCIARRVVQRSKARNTDSDRSDLRAFDFTNIQMDENVTLAPRPIPSASVVVEQPVRASGDPDGAPFAFPGRIPGEVSVDDAPLHRQASSMMGGRAATIDPSRLESASAADAAPTCRAPTRLRVPTALRRSRRSRRLGLASSTLTISSARRLQSLRQPSSLKLLTAPPAVVTERTTSRGEDRVQLSGR
jgi:hypothetical protein